MENFTIHIFGYGETQINSQDFSIKKSTKTLTTVTPLVQAIFDLKPEDNASTIDGYHAINIFEYKNIRWASKQKNVQGFYVKDNDDLKPLIDALITELETFKPQEEVVSE